MKPQIIEIKLSEIIFDENVYPRKDHDPILVQKYAQVLDEIEAKQAFIAVTADNKLIDGKHRWLAYRKAYEGTDRTIQVFRYQVSTPHEQLKLAAKLNSEHGWQLTDDDKKFSAITLYGYGCTYDDIAETLSVGKKKVSEWLARTVKENRDRRDQKIIDLWMACNTREEIEEKLGCGHSTISDIIESLADLVLKNQTGQTFVSASHLVDFDPPIYNIWKFKEKTPGSAHFGNTESKILDNLLYLYTKPFDIVVDPFAGGGSTLDVCKKRFRRYWVSDRKPIVEREKEIRKLDIAESLPPFGNRWNEVKLVYLDPPYWKQAEGKYSEDATDLANMSLDDFSNTLSGFILKLSKKLSSGAYITLIIQPTQWNAPEHQFVDHISDMLRLVRLPLDMRISAPYESQQINAQMVEWAKASRSLLVLTREIVVWRIS